MLKRKRIIISAEKKKHYLHPLTTHTLTKNSNVIRHIALKCILIKNIKHIVHQ